MFARSPARNREAEGWSIRTTLSGLGAVTLAAVGLALLPQMASAEDPAPAEITVVAPTESPSTESENPAVPDPKAPTPESESASAGLRILTPTNPPEKVWVCKFVASDNAPHGFVLKSGKQPIEVSVNALGDDVNDTGDFQDAQPSFIVPSNDSSLCSHQEVTTHEKIICPSENEDGIVKIKKTIKTYYGTVLVDTKVERSTRELTEEELEECGGDNDKKVFVCKFVASENSPGGFRLKEGKQPIEVSENALGDDVNDTGTFNDAQPSFIVPEDDPALCSHEEVKVTEQLVCPNGRVPEGIVNITTTTKLFYGTTLVDTKVEHSSRPLTDTERADCADVQLPTLALTGSDSSASLLAGALLTALGTAGVVFARRRNA